MWDRWLEYAFLARYGHQQIDTLLGRTPTPDEIRIFGKALTHWLEIDKQDPNG